MRIDARIGILVLALTLTATALSGAAYAQTPLNVCGSPHYSLTAGQFFRGGILDTAFFNYNQTIFTETNLTINVIITDLTGGVVALPEVLQRSFIGVRTRVPSNLANGSYFLAVRRVTTLVFLGSVQGTNIRDFCELITIGDPPDRPVNSISAASFQAPVAPASIVAAFGTNLATGTVQASSVPLPTNLGGTTVRVRDSAGTTRDAPLFFVSPTQVNYLMPDGTAAGSAFVTVTSGSGARSSSSVQVQPVAPGLFTANNNGSGPPSGNLLRTRADGSQSFEPLTRFDAAQNKNVPVPITFGEGDTIYLILYGTGIRGPQPRPMMPPNVAVRIGGVDVPVLFAGAQPDYVGLDQVNAGPLPASLAGRGTVDLLLTVDGKNANIVQVTFQ